MAIEVRCGCGQLVYAKARFAGQNVQCPHCKASVAVPVASATAVPPSRSPGRSVWDTETGQLWYGVFALAALAVGGVFLRGCRDDAEQNRPPMKEIMQKARDNGR